jgi:quercetin dioxygenase-like cupin family protein
MTMASTLLSPSSPAICSLLAPISGVAHGIVSQAVLTAPGLRVTQFRFAAGQELSEHTTPARALVQVLAGRCEFTLEGRTVTLIAGDLLHLPPGLPHAVRASEDVTLLIIQATPPAGSPA